MLFHQLFDEESKTYTYLLASGPGREGILIDPVYTQVDRYLTLIASLNLKLVASLETHTHADHITGAGRLKYYTDAAIMMGDETKAEYVSCRFRDNETLKFDNLLLKALHTPGHTDDSYCFLLGDKVFTGDTLLIRGTGRTDFQQGDAGLQYDSIIEKLFTLPESTQIYPAHDYQGRVSSTIAEEKKFNPRLHGKSRAEYIDLMHNLNLPLPKMMQIAVPANLKCGMEEGV